MKAKYDAVVVGSGFGGAVSACRLAQAGLDVAVIERGRRYPLGTFPRDMSDPDSGWLWSRGQGLFDVRPLNDVLIVQAAGYGGGSLVYANVQYRPPGDLFGQGWPGGYSREALDPYYDLVAYMLDVSPVTKDQPHGLPPKTALMEKVAADLGRSAQFFRPNLAVNFGDPGSRQRNKFGVEQSGCRHCGECDIGCNSHAKNTLDLNYLAVAEQHGATVVTQCEARYVATGPEGYTVHFRDHASGTDGQVSAAQVFLCAGAVNSTELLLRSRDEHRTLPDVSDRLGAGYSGNGDFLAFAFDTSPDAYLPSQGPTITTAMVYDDASPTDRTWFVFEDGGYPQSATALLQLLNSSHAWTAGTNLIWDEIGRAAGQRTTELTHRLAADSDHAAVFLVMGRDRANGTIRFVPGTDRIHVHWDLHSNLPLYVQESAFCSDVAGALGGRFVANPAWTYLHQPVSVHNLGGCLMAESAADGVVDPDGQVFGYPGLHVLDGAILPGATGANPSHTIAAVAERCVERAVRRITGNAEWSAPERSQAHPVELPEAKVTIPAGGTAPTRTAMAGIHFTETMRGTLTPVAAPAGTAVPPRRSRSESISATPPPGASNGRAPAPGGLAASFRVTIASADIARFLADPVHPAAADGTVYVEGYTDRNGEPIVGGQFNLFTDADGMYRRKMLYSLPFHGCDGRRYVLQGYKEVWDHGRFDVWASTTTLYATLVDSDDPARPSIATGVLKLDLPMFARQMSTMRITGTGSRLRQLSWLAAFGKFFTGTLFDVFVRARLDR